MYSLASGDEKNPPPWMDEKKILRILDILAEITLLIKRIGDKSTLIKRTVLLGVFFSPEINEI